MRRLVVLVLLGLAGCTATRVPVDTGSYEFAVVHSARAVAAACLDNCPWTSVQAACGYEACEIGLGWEGIGVENGPGRDLTIRASDGSNVFAYRCERERCEMTTTTWASRPVQHVLTRGAEARVDSGSIVRLTVTK